MADRYGNTHHTGCEMCGGTGTTPWVEGLGFYCNSCVSEHEYHQANPRVPDRFDLGDMNYYYAQWEPVFDHVQRSTETTLQAALKAYPGPFPGYKIREFAAADFAFKTDERGYLYLVRDDEEPRLSVSVLGTVQQPEGEYHFTPRHVRCPDGSVLHFD